MDRGIFNVDIAQTGVKEVFFLLGDFRESRGESVSTLCLSGLERRLSKGWFLFWRSGSYLSS